MSFSCKWMITICMRGRLRGVEEQQPSAGLLSSFGMGQTSWTEVWGFCFDIFLVGLAVGVMNGNFVEDVCLNWILSRCFLRTWAILSPPMVWRHSIETTSISASRNAVIFSKKKEKYHMFVSSAEMCYVFTKIKIIITLLSFTCNY